MLTSDLDYQYPESLIAQEPRANFRIMQGGAQPFEIQKNDLFNAFQAGDVLVINDTKVEKRRIFSEEGFEILFLQQLTDASTWQVLFQARDLGTNQVLQLPEGVQLRLLQKGLPQIVELNQKITPEYFERAGEMALPPYIQKVRGERRTRPEDNLNYQTQWATHRGSQAAPTASLHFTNEDLNVLRQKGVQVATVTLHVGMGTFLPVKTKNLSDHQMHGEWAKVPAATVAQIIQAKTSGHSVWALGTTVTRSLESWGHGLLQAQDSDATKGDDYFGDTKLFILPGFRFEVVDKLLTNFHQPQSTLLALVGAFSGIENVLHSYRWAIENRFRLFSYGDLSVWQKQ